MITPVPAWGLAGVLLFATPLLVTGSSASPAVNVELKTSFNAPPYLLELLFVYLRHINYAKHLGLISEANTA
jgi:hypothetical protein